VKEAELQRAINGDAAAYKAVTGVPKERLIAYFESALKKTMETLPGDIFGFGFGYDVRGNAQPVKGGVVNLTPANLYLVGKLLGTHHAGPGEKYLLTGDIRLHTPILRYMMALGLASVGINVDYAPDFLTTGAHNLLAAENPGNYRGIVQVSGSHGGPAKNGFKIKVDLGKGYQEPLYAERLQKLFEDRTKIREREKFEKFGDIVEIKGLSDRVVNMINETLPKVGKNEIAVIDSRAGSAGPIITALLEKRGFSIIDMDRIPGQKLISGIHKLWKSGKHRIAVMLNMTPDGNMGRGIWDPSKPEALLATQKLVRTINARLLEGMPKALGAVFDGDVDRISAVLEDGRAVPAFEMTLPYYQRFLLYPDNQEAIIKIVQMGGEPVKVVCDVRANSKLMGLINRVNARLQKTAGMRDRNFVEGRFITTGYPPQLSFMRNRIAELDSFVNSAPELKNNTDFMKKFTYLKKTYFTAEASGHNFFHTSGTYPNKICDDAIAGFMTLLYIRRTMPDYEIPFLGLKGKDLTDLFDGFPEAHSSCEITVPIPNDIKIDTAHEVGKWMKEKFGKELKPTTAKISYNDRGLPETDREDDYSVQPKDDGYVVVSGYKIQLRDGRTALVRWSNTSEKLTTIFEGRDLPSLISITREVTERLREEEKKGADVSNLDKEIARLEAL